MDRFATAEALREIAARLRLGGESRFRARAYLSGAEAVTALSDAAFRRHVEEGTLADVPHLGPALAAVVTELAQTGHAAILERLRATEPAGVLELTQIPGITRQRARTLRDVLGVTNLDELAAAGNAGRIREVKGFGQKTEVRILAAIESYRRQRRAIRLADAQSSAADLAAFVAGRPGITRVDVAGAVRRWEEVLEEIVIVAESKAIDAPLLSTIEQYPPWARTEAKSSDRLTGRLADGVRVRIRIAAPERRGVALIEETGPPSHVAALVQRARERGFTWEALPAADERHVYAALDLPLVPPEAREWCPLPPPPDLGELVTRNDLRGLVHCHTNHSDGRHTLQEMAEAADALGATYLTVTDHSPTASYAGGLTTDRLKAQWAEIARVQDSVRVRLLRGTESDILADGALDYPDAILEQLDVIIASIHNRYRMDAAAMTDRLVRAMELPVFKIWGHALGRLILRRDPIACDVEAVLDAVAASRAAIEISGDPYRLDLPPAWIPAARRRGIRFVISTDAHAIGDYRYLDYGVAMARRGGVRRSEVLNTLPVGAFQAAVRPASLRA